jgi:monoamine oxidase
MFTPASSFVLAFACLVNFVVATSQVQLNGRSYSIQQIISRDFAIIGGGATGTYSAVRLQDLNNSIAIVEKEAQLGGHTYTYIDPNTGSGVEAGVQVFHNNSLVHQYFSRFNISLGPPIFRPVSDGTQFYDLETGALTNYTAPSNAAFGAAVAKYAAQIAKYPEIANGLNPSYPVADDLLLPFGDFIAKYGVADST